MNKKIIAAVDAVNFTKEQLLQYNQVAKKLNGKLIVAFLENIITETLPVTPGFPYGAYTGYDEINWKPLEETRKQIKQKIELFHEVCKEHNLDVHLHEDSGIPVDEIVKESRFADLLLLGNNITFSTVFETDPPRFVKDVLRNGQCPVLVLPQATVPMGEIIFTYNGSYSSMYAIRQLTLLFEPDYNEKVTILYVDEHGTGAIPEEKLLTEYLRHHYKNVDFKILKGDPSFEVTNFLLRRPNCVVTFGAYSRSKLSQFFHQSDAEKLLRLLNIPVFITHP